MSALEDKIAGLQAALATASWKEDLKDQIKRAQEKLEATRAAKAASEERIKELRDTSSELVAVPVVKGAEAYGAVVDKYLGIPAEKEAFDEINVVLAKYPCKKSHGSKAKAGVKQPAGFTVAQLQAGGASRQRPCPDAVRGGGSSYYTGGRR